MAKRRAERMVGTVKHAIKSSVVENRFIGPTRFLRYFMAIDGMIVRESIGRSV